MPRTTIDLDATILAQLRERASREGKSMGAVGSELLARALDDSGMEEGEPFEWPSFDLGKPLVDLEDAEAVRRALDQGSL
ncbi:MAG: antitoxin [Solirubrobacterales bacterium]